MSWPMTYGCLVKNLEGHIFQEQKRYSDEVSWAIFSSTTAWKVCQFLPAHCLLLDLQPLVMDMVTMVEGSPTDQVEIQLDI